MHGRILPHGNFLPYFFAFLILFSEKNNGKPHRSPFFCLAYFLPYIQV